MLSNYRFLDIVFLSTSFNFFLLFYSTDNAPPALHILYASIYVGSLPKKIKLQPNRVASTDAFNGCIGDLTVNGQIKNFANTTDSSKEILDKCILDTKIDVIDTGKGEVGSFNCI